MNDRLQALERLERLRQSHVLTEAEFEVEKARILAAHGGSDPATADGRSTRLIWAAVIVVLLAAVVVAGLAMSWARRNGDDRPAAVDAKGAAETPVAPSETNVSKPVEDPEAQIRALPAAEQASQAFELVFGTVKPVVVKKDGTEATTKPEMLYWAPFGPVLITSTTLKDGCHGCAGSLGVFYLKVTAGGFSVVRKFPDAVSGSSWGVPPLEWSISDKFLTGPAIYSTAGGTWQGFTCGAFTLHELTPAGPVDRGGAPLDYSDASGGMGDGGQYEGKVANIVRGKSFDVTYSGTRSFTDHYEFSGGRYAVVGKQMMETC